MHRSPCSSRSALLVAIGLGTMLAAWKARSAHGSLPTAERGERRHPASLAQQIGAGTGDLHTPDSSMYLIKRDPVRSIRRGRQLFQRKFTGAHGLGQRTGDGVGDIAAEASHGAGRVDSCAGCHGRPAARRASAATW